MSNTKKLFATRDFTDAGTQRSFTAGQAVEVNENSGLTQGMVDNYAATNLVTDKQPEPDEGDQPTAASGKSTGGKPA